MKTRRPSLRHGLPYGWWRSPDFWAAVFFLSVFCSFMTVVFLAWWLDLKP